MLDVMTIIRALADENRVRILLALRDREMCVCQVTAFLDLSPSTTSKHLSILKQARLIESRKKGKWVYYRLAEGAASAPRVRGALSWIIAEAAGCRVIRDDACRIADILERERQICAGTSDAADSFHSLEIHTLSDSEMNAASVGES